MKQHYVPASYLAGFGDPSTPAGRDPYLWVVDFEQRTVRARAPVNVAARTNYNAWPELCGEINHAAEELFGQFESAAIPVIRSLVRQPHRLNDEDFGALNAFIALQFVRVPAVRDRLLNFRLSIAEQMMALLTHNRGAFDRTTREAHPDRDFSEEQPDSAYEFARHPSNYTLSMDEWAALPDAFKLAEGAEPVLGRMQWSCLTTSADTPFITGDRPVSAVNPVAGASPVGHGLKARDIEVTFPLAPTACYLGCWRDMASTRMVAPETVLKINRRTIFSAGAQCYASSRALAEFALTIRSQTGG